MRNRYLFVSMALALTVGLAACGGDSDESAGDGVGESSQGESGKVALIGVAPVTQGNWDPAGYHAFTAMAEKYGLEATNQESVAYDQAPAVLRRLAGENDMIIAHSSGYEAAVLEVAPEFPDVQFVVFSDLSTTKGLPNVAGWAINWNELAYLATAANCFAAKTDPGNKLGDVAGEPIPAFTRFAGGAQQAADELGCELLIQWINSFTDVAKAKQAGLSMVADGAEALTSTADTADEGTREAAIEADVLFTAVYTESEIELAPDNTITSVLVDFDKAYDEMGKLFTTGRLEPKIYNVNVEEGDIFYAKPFHNVDKTVERQSLETLEGIRSGKIKVDPTAEVMP